jgi:cell division initiation protein
VSLTPVEIRHVKLKRRLLGYDRGSVERVLEDIRTSFEAVWRERADLQEEVERLEGEVGHYRELEVSLRDTLVWAERAADDMKAQAGREAELVLEDARLKAREIVVAAEMERERLRTEIRRLRAVEADTRAGYKAFLVTALERVEASHDELEAPEQAA